MINGEFTAPKRPEFGPVIDPACAEQIQVSSRLMERRGQQHVMVSATCQRCAGCVIAYAGDIGNEQHLAEIGREFCAPGEFSPNS